MWPGSRAQALEQEEGPVVFLAGEIPYDFITGALERSRAAGTPWENKLTLRSFYHIAKAEPRDFANRITVPALYLAAEEDPLTGPLETHREVFATMGPNAEFQILGPHHLATYFGDPFEAAIKTQLEFLSRVL